MPKDHCTLLDENFWDATHTLGDFFGGASTWRDRAGKKVWLIPKTLQIGSSFRSSTDHGNESCDSLDPIYQAVHGSEVWANCGQIAFSGNAKTPGSLINTGTAGVFRGGTGGI